MKVLYKQAKQDTNNCSQTQLSYACKKPRGGAPTTPQPTPTPEGNCPPSFQKFDNECYRISSGESAGWYDARDQCKKMGRGFNLASIHSMKENAFIAAMLYEDSNQDSKEVWIGGASTSKGAREFLWADQTDFNIDNWAPGQPDQVIENFILISIVCFVRLQHCY